MPHEVENLGLISINELPTSRKLQLSDALLFDSFEIKDIISLSFVLTLREGLCLHKIIKYVREDTNLGEEIMTALKINKMKKIALILLTGLMYINGFGQDITGTWYGILFAGGMNIKLVFHIDKTNKEFESTFDVPDQKVFGLPVASTSFSGTTLKLSIKAGLPFDYVGEFGLDTIIGKFLQNGAAIPLNLSRRKENISPTIPKRPQEPTKPYPYYSEDIPTSP